MIDMQTFGVKRLILPIGFTLSCAALSFVPRLLEASGAGPALSQWTLIGTLCAFYALAAGNALYLLRSFKFSLAKAVAVCIGLTAYLYLLAWVTIIDVTDNEVPAAYADEATEILGAMVGFAVLIPHIAIWLLCGLASAVGSRRAGPSHP